MDYPRVKAAIPNIKPNKKITDNLPVIQYSIYLLVMYLIPLLN